MNSVTRTIKAVENKGVIVNSGFGMLQHHKGKSPTTAVRRKDRKREVGGGGGFSEAVEVLQGLVQGGMDLEVLLLGIGQSLWRGRDESCIIRLSNTPRIPRYH